MSTAKTVIPILTEADESFTGYSTDKINGILLSALFRPDSAVGNQMSATSEITVTTEETAKQIWAATFDATASQDKHPRIPLHDTSGIATGGLGFMPLSNERIKVVVANGGVSKRGTVIIEYQGRPEPVSQ